MDIKETLISIGKFIAFGIAYFVITWIIEQISSYKVEGELSSNPEGLTGAIKHIVYWLILQSLVFFYCLYKVEDKLSDAECKIKNLEDKIKTLELETVSDSNTISKLNTEIIDLQYDVDQLKTKLRGLENKK